MTQTKPAPRGTPIGATSSELEPSSQDARVGVSVSLWSHQQEPVASGRRQQRLCQAETSSSAKYRCARMPGMSVADGSALQHRLDTRYSGTLPGMRQLILQGAIRFTTRKVAWSSYTILHGGEHHPVCISCSILTAMLLRYNGLLRQTIRPTYYTTDRSPLLLCNNTGYHSSALR